ncbi:unnamed protein product, partial [Linum tenue]
ATCSYSFSLLKENPQKFSISCSSFLQRAKSKPIQSEEGMNGSPLLPASSFIWTEPQADFG